MNSFSSKYDQFLPSFLKIHQDLPLPDAPESFYLPIRYHLQGRGKALRPAILCAVAESLGADRETCLPAALAIELLHNFTLIHDDIMDDDDRRHGQTTLHRKWNSNSAILAGDGLFALAFRELLQLPDRFYRPVSEIFIHKILAVCEGQSYDLQFENDRNVSTVDYFRMVTLKTAELLSAAMEAGAILGNAEKELQRGIARFGLDLGRIFQIQDDLLELTASENDMGKSLDSDIRAGKKTYPLIYAAEKAFTANDRELLTLLRRSSYNDKQVRELKMTFRERGFEQEIRKKLTMDIEALQEGAARMPADTRDLLIDFAQFILDRKK